MRGGKRVETERRQKREEEGCSEISGEACGSGTGLMEGGRERFVKDNEAREGGILLKIRVDKGS